MNKTNKNKTNKTRKIRQTSTSLTTPKKDGYYMPAEFETQQATWLGWPSNSGTFRIKQARLVIEKVARIISKYQKVYIAAPPADWYKAVELFKNNKNIFVIEIVNNDAWLRDIAPTFLVKKNGKIKLRGLGWKFNGWGKPKEIKHDQDALVSMKISNILSIPFYKKFDFVCEGGSFSVDGAGTLITTSECLLNENRNKNLSKSQIEDVLRKYLNVTKIIWLPYGVAADHDTDGHVDNMCVFAGVGKLLLAWPKGCGTPECLDKDQEMRSLAAMKVLEKSTDANGNPIKVFKIPHPPITRYTQSEVESLPAVEGSYVRKAGDRLDASHVNLIITNKIVVVPTFNCSSDKDAINAIAEAFPNRQVVGVYAREILLGGGNIHCMSQQQPISETECY
uniref:Agmatine deiminase n=1 Tax=viral metagenome TaxID=1070528 RepID=A0A6C0HYD7_9ZZZZ